MRLGAAGRFAALARGGAVGLRGFSALPGAGLAIEPPSGVEVKPGEVVVFRGNGAGKTGAVVKYFVAMTTTLFTGVSLMAERLFPVEQVLQTADMATLSAKAVQLNPWLEKALIFTSGFTWLMAVSQAKGTVSAAVLTADGRHLRVYPYGALFASGVGSPVVVPIKCLRIHVDSEAKKVASDALFVRTAAYPEASPGASGESMRLSSVALNFDKPKDVGEVAKVNGPALVYDARGLAAVQLTPGETLAAEPEALRSALDESQRIALRRYALLGWLLGGREVDPSRVQSGDWDLRHMAEDLDVDGGKSAKERASSALAYWRKARGAGGDDYWYHALDGRVQWEEPMIDGKGPAEWHPGLF